MLYFIHGSDFTKSQTKYHDLIDSLKVRQPDSAAVFLDNENFSEAKLQELVASQGLFYQKSMVGLNQLLSHKKIGPLLETSLPGLASSANIFILLEEQLSPEQLKKVTPLATKVLAFNLKNQPLKIKANTFALGDALTKRDKKNLWLEYVRSLAAGEESGEIFWRLWWQAKMLLLAKLSKTKDPKNISPFVWSKAKRGSENYSEEELRSLASKLVKFYHSNFVGTDEFNFRLEKILLEI